MSAMWALMKKDWRIYRGPVIAMALGVGAWCVVELTCFEPFQIAAGVPVLRPRVGPQLGHFLQNWLPFSSIVYGFVLSAVFGAAAFARERHDRSAQFLAMLPVTRWEIVLSKLLVIYGCFTIAWALESLVRILVYPHTIMLSMLTEFLSWFWPPIQMIAFGLAWTLSIFLESATIAGAVSVGVFVILGIITGLPGIAVPQLAWWSAFDVVGVGAFILATIYYLRRVEP